MKNARPQAIIVCMRWGLGLAGLAAIAAIVLAVLLLRPSEPRSAVAPEPAASPVAGPATPTLAPPLEPVAPHADSSSEALPERRIASPVPTAAPELGSSIDVIVGRVIGSLGQGLAGVSITAARPDGSAGSPGIAAASLQSGEFQLAHAPGSRPSHVHFEAGGYVPRVLEVPAPDEGPWQVVLQLRPVIEGVVLDRTGRPVPPPGFVNVHILPEDPQAQQHYSAKLESNGHYTFAELHPGRLRQITARAKGFDEHVIELDLSLPAGARQSHEVILERGLVVYGVVLDELTREPVPYAKVWGETLDYEEASFHPTTIADAAGRFRIEGFESNTVDFGESAYHTFMIVASSEEHASSPLSVVALEPDENGEFEVELLLVRSSCSVGGRVLQSDGQTPASGALIWAIDGEHNHTLQVTRGRGRFEFTGLPPGPFAMLVYRTGRGTNGLYESLRFELDLQDGAAEDLRLVLATSTGASLTGHMLDAAGAPVRGVEVTASFQFHAGGLTMGLDSEASITDADGRYRFPDTRAGLYVITPAGCAEPQSFQLTLAPFEQRAIDFVAGTCMTIEGWVELGEAPASEFEVRLFNLEGQMIQDADLSSDGTFRVSEVIETSYEVILFRHGERIDQAPVPAGNPTGIVLRVP